MMLRMSEKEKKLDPKVQKSASALFCFLFSLIFLTLSSLSHAGTTYYVSSGQQCSDIELGDNGRCATYKNSKTSSGVTIPPGSDSNPGTEDQPFLTVQQALKTIGANGAGVTVILRDGVYDTVNGLKTDNNSDTLIPAGSSWDAPFSMQAYPGNCDVNACEKVSLIRELDSSAQSRGVTVAKLQSKTCADKGGNVADCVGVPTLADCQKLINLPADGKWQYPNDCWSGSGNKNGDYLGYGWYVKQDRENAVTGPLIDAVGEFRQVRYVIFDGIIFNGRGVNGNILSNSVRYDHKLPQKDFKFKNGEWKNSVVSCMAQPGIGNTDYGATGRDRIPNTNDEGEYPQSPYGDTYWGISWEHEAKLVNGTYVQGDIHQNNFEFKNFKIHHCGVPYNTFTINGVNAREIPNSKFLHGWYMHVGGNTCDNCEAYKNAGTGVGPDGPNNIIRNSYIHNNSAQGLYIAGGHNWVVENNVFYNNTGAEIYYYNGSGHQIRNNTVFAGPNNVDYGIYLHTASQGSFIDNNIVDGFRQGIYSIQEHSTPNTVRNNLLRTVPSGREIYINSWATPVISSGNLKNLDPLFESTSPPDFRIKSNSPAINAGIATDLTGDFLGNTRIDGAIDIGAFEYGGPSVTRCTTASSSVTVGQAATFLATGGSGYTWSATAGSPTSGSGSTFTTTFNTSGVFTVNVNGGGNSATCNVTVTPPDTQAPSIPSNVTANAVSSFQVDIKWSGSTDNEGVVGYNIYRGIDKTGTSSALTFSDTQVTDDTVYNYSVQAFDGAGNTSAKSSGVSVRTPKASSTLTLDKTSYAVGETISINVVNGGVLFPKDWLGIIDDVTQKFADWRYLNGSKTAPTITYTSANINLTAPSTAGTYTVKLYANDADPSISSAIKASTANIQVTSATGIQQVSMPTFSPESTNFTLSQNVTILSAASGAEIRYTLDGSTPTANSTLFSGPIQLSATTTIKAIAIKSGLTNSQVSSATYTVQNASTPILNFSANPPTVTSGGSSTLTWSSTNATSCTASGGWTGSKATNGTFTVNPTATATYTLKCDGASGASDTKSVGVTVNTTTTQYSLSVAATSVEVGGNISVSWTALPCAQTPCKDWIALVRAGDPNSGYNAVGKWEYTNGATSGTMNVTAPTTNGTYDFRFLLNDGYTDVARSAAISVTGGGTPTDPGTGTAGTYYVASGEVCGDVNCSVLVPGGPQNGSDTNPGTESQPFKTLQKALRTIGTNGAGSKVILRNGAYDTVNGLKNGNDTLLPTGSSWNAPFIIQAAQGEQVWLIRGLNPGASKTVAQMQSPSCGGLDCVGAPTVAECVAVGYPAGGYPENCWSGGGSAPLYVRLDRSGGNLTPSIIDAAGGYERPVRYVIFDGIIFDARGINGNIIANTTTYGYELTQKHFKFLNGEFKNSASSCFAQPGIGGEWEYDPQGNLHQNEFEFKNFKIHHCGIPFNTHMINGENARDISASKFLHGWYLHTGGNTCDGCEIYKNAGTGVGPDGPNNIVRNSYVHDNACYGIDMGGGYNHQVYNTVLYNNGCQAEINANSLGSSVNPYNQHKIFNNTIIVGPKGPDSIDAGIYIKTGWHGSLVENNIIVGLPRGIVNNACGSNTAPCPYTDQNMIRNNLIVSASSNKEIDNNSYPIVLPLTVGNIFNQDPKFVSVNPNDPNFAKLQSASPAINAGFANGYTTDKEGALRSGGIDLGAYEYGGVISTRCSPVNQNASQGNNATWTASGTSGTTFSWSAPGGNPASGTGATFSTVFSSTGSKTVTVSGNGTSATCIVNVSAPDTQAPSVPTGLSATAASSTQINLAWAASTDNVGVAGYNIYRNGSTTPTGTTITNSFSDTGLTPSTTYQYTVAAYDAASNTSTQSTNVSATTSAPGTGSGTTKTLTINATNAVNGVTIAMEPPDIDGLSACSVYPCVRHYNTNTAVRLHAPDMSQSGYYDRWSGDCDPTNNNEPFLCTVTMTADKNVSASFGGDGCRIRKDIAKGQNVSICWNGPIKLYSFWDNSGVFVGTQPTGSAGSVIDGPFNFDGDSDYVNVDFNSGTDGWLSTANIINGLPANPKFTVGARVQVSGTAAATVRKSADINSSSLGTHGSGDQGTVIGGRINNLQDNFIWWLVQYDAGAGSDANGAWTQEQMLAPLTGGGSGTVVAPSFSPAAGNISGPTPVSLSTSTSGAQIFYTTNGSTPTTSSTLYSGPIQVTASTTIKAIAIKSGLTNSQVSSATYTVQNASTPILNFSANPPTVTSGGSSTLTWSSTNATSCTASGGWTGTKAISGTLAVTPSITTTYTLTCSGPGGSTPRDAVVTVGTSGGGGCGQDKTFNPGDRVQVCASAGKLNLTSAPGGPFLVEQPILAQGTVLQLATPSTLPYVQVAYLANSQVPNPTTGWSTTRWVEKVVGAPPINTPPHVSAINADTGDVDPAAPGLQFYPNTTVRYSGSASDAEGDTLNWKWIYTLNGSPTETIFTSGTGTILPATFSYGAASAGTAYHWILRVDDTKATSESTLDVNIIARPLGTSTTTLASSLNPAGVGINVTLTATVTGQSPTGTVSFTDAGSAITGCSAVTVSAGNAQCTTNTLTLGTHPITATYSGDANNGGSSSTPLSQVIGKSASTTALSSSANPATFGNSVALTATVSGQSPTGTVSFTDAGVAISGCSSVALVSGQGSCTVSNLSVGTHNITATYGGDSKNTGSASAPLSQLVNKKSTTTSLVSSLNPSGGGVAVTFSATVTGAGLSGTVNFIDAGSSLSGCSAVALVSNQASCTVGNLALGIHPIVAAYSGDANSAGSASVALNQAVGQNATTTVLSSSLNPSVAGDTMTLTAAVNGQSPTGTVSFTEAGTAIGNCSAVAVLSGSAACTLNSLSVGTHAITAAYGGDANNLASNGFLSQIVGNKAATATNTILASSTNPSALAGPVTFTATVTGAAAISGTVSFTEGSNVLSGCLAIPVAATKAACTISNLSAGPHSIIASYSGDANNLNSVSPALVQTVNKLISSTTLASSLNPLIYGDNVTLTATIAGTLTGPSPSGSVNFTDGVNLISSCTGVAVADGKAQCDVNTLTVGSHPIKAIYSGDINYNGSTSSTLTQSVGKKTTSITISSSSNPSLIGEGVSLTATVNGTSPTGTVTFVKGTTVLAGCSNLALVNRAAACSVTNLTVGTNTIVVTYGGDLNNAASSAQFLQVVNKNASTTVLISALNPSMVGDSVTLTANVLGAAPTGTVRFVDAATTISGCSAVALGSGSAKCTVSNFSQGAHSIVATYNGDGLNAVSSSPALIQTVNKKSTSVTIVSSLNPSITGNSVVFTAAVTGQSPTGTIGFSDGGSPITGCTAVALSSSKCTLSNLSTGTHSIVATYSGDSTNGASSSPPLIQTVNKRPTTVGFSSSLNPSALGDTVVLTATVAGQSPTGTVSFTDGGSSIGSCSAVAVASGSATCTLTSLSLGIHILEATYSGDATNGASTSNPLTQTVFKMPSTTTLRSSVNPSMLGDSVTLTATVVGSTPTGTVSFNEGSSVLGGCSAVGLTNGTAQCTISSLSVATHPMAAVYSGDNSNTGSTSATLNQTVNNKPVSSTNLTSSLNPSTIGANVTFTATVSGSSPTGTVSFTDGGIAITGCSTKALSNSSATCTVNTLTAGTHAILAAYSGDGNNVASSSSPLAQVVNKIANTVTVTSSLNPATIGDSVVLTAAVAGQTPTGTVSFSDGGTSLGSCTAMAVASGSAQCTLTSLSVGGHSIVAAYSGDNTNAGASSLAFNQVVNKRSTSTSLSSSLNPSMVGAEITLTANVTGSALTGSVSFLAGATTINGCSAVTISNGSAQCKVSTLGVGAHNLSASYSGDSVNAGSTSPVLAQTVSNGSTVVALTSSLNPSIFGSAVTFSAIVTGNAPTGTVSFKDGGVAISGCASVSLSSGPAQCSTASLSRGVHVITASYSGDANNAPSTSTVLSQTVDKKSTTATLSSSVNPSTVGDTITLNAQVSGNTPTGTVAFSDGGVSIVNCAAVGLSNASATCTLVLSGAGNHNLVATYGGDANHATSSSPTLVQVVNKKSSGTNLSSSLNPSMFGDGLSLVATITGVSTTGTVRFNDGSDAISGCAAVPVVNASAVCTVASLGVGTHSISALYSGDATNASSTSNALPQTVNKKTTTTSLNSSLNPASLNHNVVLTATVAGLSPGGTVRFTDGGINISGCAALVLISNTAACSVSTLTLGPHTIVASYSGDTAHAPSSSSALLQTIAPVTVVSLESSLNPAARGAAVTLTATVIGVAPSGTMSFMEGQNSLSGCDAVPLDADGKAQCTSATLNLGPHALVANYSGDTVNPPSSSGIFTQVITQRATTTTMSSSANPSMVSAALTLTASVTGTNLGGTVSFTDAGTTIPGCTAVAVAGNGSASCTVNNLSVGVHNLIALYSGDAANAASASSIFAQTIDKKSSFTVLSSPVNPSVVGDSITVTATVSGLTPTGTVSFSDGGSGIVGCSAVAVTTGSAQCSFTILHSGSHSLSAFYNGDANNTASLGNTLVQNVNKKPSSAVLESSLNPSFAGDSVTWTATISGVAPNGTAVFLDGSATINVCASVTVSGGRAQCTVSNLGAGTHTIRVSYSGDANNLPSVSGPLSQTINKRLTSTSVSSSLNPSTMGDNVTFTASVSGATPTGTVGFTENGSPISGCSARPIGGGTATCAVSSLNVGTHAVVATYSGDGANEASSNAAAPLSQTIKIKLFTPK